MILFYCDDAGNTGTNLKDANQPYHYLTALAVPEAKWINVQNDYVALVNTYFPTLVDKNGCVQSDFELHAAEIWGRKGYFKSATLTTRCAILEGAISIIEKHDLYLVYGCCNKPALAARYAHPAHPHWVASFLCLERCATYADNLNQLGIVIADKNQSVEQMVHDFVERYRRDGPPWGNAVQMGAITDNVHFMGSHESPHMQLCDVANWILFRAKRGLPFPAPIAKLPMRVGVRVTASRTMPY